MGARDAFEFGAQRRRVVGQAHEIGGNPDRAAREDGNAVDAQAEARAVLAVIDLDAAEAEAAGFNRLAVERDARLVQRRRAVGGRPP